SAHSPPTRAALASAYACPISPLRGTARVLSSIGDGPYTKRQRAREHVMQAWIMLAAAGLFEIVWAIGLKYADGFTKPVPSAITITAMVISMWLLAQAARDLPIGTAYAVWTGIGAVGAAL